MALSAWGAKQGQHAPGAGAQVDQPRNGPAPAACSDRGLHRRLGHIERADLVPAGGVVGEIGRRVLRRARLHIRQPFGVAGQDRVVRLDQPSSAWAATMWRVPAPARR